MLLEFLISTSDSVSSSDTAREKKKKKKFKQERFKRDCQNVTGGNGSGEVERGHTGVEQEVEAVVSASVSVSQRLPVPPIRTCFRPPPLTSGLSGRTRRLRL